MAHPIKSNEWTYKTVKIIKSQRLLALDHPQIDNCGFSLGIVESDRPCRVKIAAHMCTW